MSGYSDMQSSFDIFVSQIQFSINSFLAVFGIIVAISIGFGVYFIRRFAKDAAAAGIKEAQRSLDLQNTIIKRMETLELSQKNMLHYISNVGIMLYRAPLSNGHGESGSNEYAYYGRIEHTLYLTGSFHPHGTGDCVLMMPCGFRPNLDVNIIVVPCNGSIEYRTVRLLHTGELRSDIPASDCLYTFQAYLDQTD